jgi:hypothetical protein
LKVTTKINSISIPLRSLYELEMVVDIDIADTSRLNTPKRQHKIRIDKSFFAGNVTAYQQTRAENMRTDTCSYYPWENVKMEQHWFVAAENS